MMLHSFLVGGGLQGAVVWAFIDAAVPSHDE
jgi:hypothetical protein